jgi:hypothetical protein
MRRDDLLSSRTHPFSGTDVWALVQMRAQRSGDRIAFAWHPYHGSPREWTFRDWHEMRPGWPQASSSGASELATAF